MEKKIQLEASENSEESGDVKGETVDSWKERPPELVKGYSKDDIWNMDESAWVYWKALPDCWLWLEGKGVQGRKEEQTSLNLAFLVTASGKKEKPVVTYMDL